MLNGYKHSQVSVIMLFNTRQAYVTGPMKRALNAAIVKFL